MFWGKLSCQVVKFSEWPEQYLGITRVEVIYLATGMFQGSGLSLRKLSINVIKFGLEAHSLCTGVTGVFMPYSLRLIGT